MQDMLPSEYINSKDYDFIGRRITRGIKKDFMDLNWTLNNE